MAAAACCRARAKQQEHSIWDALDLTRSGWATASRATQTATKLATDKDSTLASSNSEPNAHDTSSPPAAQVAAKYGAALGAHTDHPNTGRNEKDDNWKNSTSSVAHLRRSMDDVKSKPQ